MKIHLLICELLLLLSICGLCGLMLFKDYIKKISCLSVSYGGFLMLFILLALKNHNLSQIISISSTILIIFSINLLIIMAIAKNINESCENSP